jgi:carbamoyltransferase
LDDGRIRATVHAREIVRTVEEIANSGKREDVAASVQDVLEELTLASLDRSLKCHPAKNLALCGGVFANVKLTQRIAERFPFAEIFVYPAMSDQGEAAGGALEYLLERDGLKTWLANRAILSDVYLGRDYTASADAVFRAAGAEAVLSTPCGDAELAQRCTELIIDGKIVGTYLGRGEYGPRALGARSIMAAAVDRRINDWLNQRLERTEFMPFAPVVRKERCAELFDLPQSLCAGASQRSRRFVMGCGCKLPSWCVEGEEQGLFVTKAVEDFCETFDSWRTDADTPTTHELVRRLERRLAVISHNQAWVVTRTASARGNSTRQTTPWGANSH